MNIERVGFSRFAGRKACRRGHARSGERPEKRLRDLYRKYARRYASAGGVLRGRGRLTVFLRFHRFTTVFLTKMQASVFHLDKFPSARYNRIIAFGREAAG